MQTTINLCILNLDLMEITCFMPESLLILFFIFFLDFGLYLSKR